MRGVLAKPPIVEISIVIWLMGKVTGMDVLASYVLFMGAAQIAGLLLAMVSYWNCSMDRSACLVVPGCRYMPECQGLTPF